MEKAAVERKVKRTGAKKWAPKRVIRADAGGTLWAAVDQDGNESGGTPSYDSSAIQRRCDFLNAAENGTGNASNPWGYPSERELP